MTRILVVGTSVAQNTACAISVAQRLAATLAPIHVVTSYGKSRDAWHAISEPSFEVKCELWKSRALGKADAHEVENSSPPGGISTMKASKVWCPVFPENFMLVVDQVKSNKAMADFQTWQGDVPNLLWVSSNPYQYVQDISSFDHVFLARTGSVKRLASFLAYLVPDVTRHADLMADASRMTLGSYVEVLPAGGAAASSQALCRLGPIQQSNFTPMVVSKPAPSVAKPESESKPLEKTVSQPREQKKSVLEFPLEVLRAEFHRTSGSHDELRALLDDQFQRSEMMKNMVVSQRVDHAVSGISVFEFSVHAHQRDLLLLLLFHLLEGLQRAGHVSARSSLGLGALEG